MFKTGDADGLLFKDVDSDFATDALERALEHVSFFCVVAHVETKFPRHNLFSNYVFLCNFSNSLFFLVFLYFFNVLLFIDLLVIVKKF